MSSIIFSFIIIFILILKIETKSSQECLDYTAAVERSNLIIVGKIVENFDDNNEKNHHINVKIKRILKGKKEGNESWVDLYLNLPNCPDQVGQNHFLINDTKIILIQKNQPRLESSTKYLVRYPMVKITVQNLKHTQFAIAGKCLFCFNL